MKISPGWLKQNIFLKIKNASQKNLYTLFCLRGFHLKCHFQYAFDDNLSITHIFIKQIFRAVDIAPPPLPPHGCAGGGVVVALFTFSYKPWLWLWL
jgi:hypothetical protein